MPSSEATWTPERLIHYPAVQETAVSPDGSRVAYSVREPVLTEDEFLAIDAAAQKEVDDAVAFAEAGTWEPVEDLTRDVCTPHGSAP